MENDEVEMAKTEFVCVKFYTGEVVDTFDRREDALALVKKNAKNKRAKLYVMDSRTGKKISFTDEELR